MHIYFTKVKKPLDVFVLLSSLPQQSSLYLVVFFSWDIHDTQIQYQMDKGANNWLYKTKMQNHEGESKFK